MARRVKALPGPAKTEGFVEVTKGIHTFVGGGGRTNFTLVLTKDKPVVIDNDIRARKRFLAGARRITRKSPGLLLNTHHNFDHTSDNGYYHAKGAVSFGCEVVREEMLREYNAGTWVTQMLGRGPKVDHLVGKLGVEPPMVTFDDLLTVRYGGRIFQIIYIGHCHTRGDSVVWMPEERVLFSGDLLNHRTHPVARLGNFENWLQALPLLKKFPARCIVPGHGPIPPRGTGIVDDVKGYLTRLRSRTAAALRREGAPVKASARVRMDEYAKWFRPQLVPQNALKMARELRQKRR